MISQQELKALLAYDPETGFFTWLTKASAKKAGEVAGYRNGRYTQIGVNGKVYLGHRLAWLYINGEFPSGDIDHVNGDKNDNRIANLRAATRSENNQNLGVRADNKTGHPGIQQTPQGRWSAVIQIQGKRIWLGNHTTKEDAIAARVEGKRVHHPFQPQLRTA